MTTVSKFITPDFKTYFSKLDSNSYSDLINKTIGSDLFRHLIRQEGEDSIDLTQNGKLSCAYYVSQLLHYLNYIKEPHATVASTIQDMIACEREQHIYEQDSEIPVGSVLLRETQTDDETGPHMHIGFYIGNNEAVSNSSTSGVIEKHHFTFEGKRKIEHFYTGETKAGRMPLIEGLGRGIDAILTS